MNVHVRGDRKRRHVLGSVPARKPGSLLSRFTRVPSVKNDVSGKSRTEFPRPAPYRRLSNSSGEADRSFPRRAAGVK